MANTKGMIKTETHTPRKRCLNAGLIPAKEENFSPESHGLARSPFSGEATKLLAAEALPAEPAQAPINKKVAGKFNVKPGRLAISLSSPSAGRGGTKRAAPFDDSVHRRPPPPPLPADLATGGTAQTYLSGPGIGRTVAPGGRSTVTAKKQVINAFNHQRKYLENDPALKQHLDDLTKKHPRGHPEIWKFKKLIGDCRHGKFDTPELNEIRRKIQVKNWGKNNELGSWKAVLDRHGENVAYAALRQGTLPYVPHSLLRPGHGVKWPESHEFILERRYWKTSWREEVNFETPDERTATAAEIDDFLAKRGDVSCPGWDEMLARAATGIPSGMDCSQPAEPAREIKTEEERAVHPQHCGKKYDEQHAATQKNLQKVIAEWPKNKSRHEISLAKADSHPLCKEVVNNTKTVLGAADATFKKLENTYKQMEVKGKGFLSMKQLEESGELCESVWKQNRDIVEMVKALDQLSKLPAKPSSGTPSTG